SYNEYFAWPNYWESMHGPWVIGPFGMSWYHQEENIMAKKAIETTEELEKCHLQSLSEICSYRIVSGSHHFGHIQSVLFEMNSFKIDFWVADTINFLPSKLV